MPNWQRHVIQLLKECSFCSMYHLQYVSFFKLVHSLSPSIMVPIILSKAIAEVMEVIMFMWS
jgi:hypothetical protein